MLLWSAFGDEWALNHKVSFDGVNRTITVAPSVSQIDVKVDLYSSWKEWLRLYDNAKFLPAMRSIGGDPIGGGVFAGDLYFLQNGWRVVVNHLVSLRGSLFTEEGASPYIIGEGGGVISTVSNLATAVSAESAPVDTDAVAAAVWNALMGTVTPGSFGEQVKQKLATKLDLLTS